MPVTVTKSVTVGSGPGPGSGRVHCTTAAYGSKPCFARTRKAARHRAVFIIIMSLRVRLARAPGITESSSCHVIT